MKQTKQISQKKTETTTFKEKQANNWLKQKNFFKKASQMKQVQFHGSRHRG